MDYAERVNRAVDHIVRNLARPLRLEEVSAAAGFSPFHFHRIFKTLLGETLQQFVKRQRLERALYLMSHAPGRSLTDVALDCGFSSSSDFSRSFRQHHGVAPSLFDLEAFRSTRRDAFERILTTQAGSPLLTALPAGQNPDGFEVVLRELPARTVAYIRVHNPYREGAVQAACERLLAWAIPRGLADGQWLGYMWDEPEIVELAKCRYDVALVVDDFQPAGEIGRFEFSPMRVAELVLRGDMALEARAFDWLYKTWLPRSGHVPDHQPAFEAWIGRPFAHGNAHFELACQLPVQPG
ncbi:AraC family transcriptional regulator [Ideonella azotifigens]|uniref:AraC family transcriptional regulator n=1 Tax=Ideonella azotifigens TaxID=513160 RepID=A0ABN1JJE2_9BURK|nr:AraC family transcriptional regulator [Ideonella azotifigens]MCD2341964.1 AraC family transcriptional regulator [Ideonella azotifigens]